MRTLSLGLLLFSVLRCSTLDGYSTVAGESYCGAIGLAKSFRTGLNPNVQMRLELDASLMEGTESPGVISTYEAIMGTDYGKRFFDESPLRVLEPLQHDVLSRLDLGEGRERSALYALTPKDSFEESVLAVVSLRSDGDVEVRLLRPGKLKEAATSAVGTQPIFGVFHLRKQRGSCGF